MAAVTADLHINERFPGLLEVSRRGGRQEIDQLGAAEANVIIL